MKYKVTLYSNTNSKTFESDSSDGIKHLRTYGGHTCRVKDKTGKCVAEARYSDDCGYYNVVPNQY